MLKKSEMTQIKKAILKEYYGNLETTEAKKLNLLLKKASKKQNLRLFTLKRRLHSRRFNRQNLKFKSILGVDMPVDSFMDRFLGKKCLDVFELDRILKIPSGISMNDFIKSKYGKDTLEFIKSLI